MEVKQNKYKKLGIISICIAIFLWCLVLVVPFLWFDTTTTSVIIWGLLLWGECFFWLGTFLAGKEVIKKLFKKKL